MKKVVSILVISMTLGMSSLFAAPNLEMGDGAKKLAEMAGEMSPYYRAKKEDFPKDYFLVNQNLPFLVGASLYHPNSDTLKLDKGQLEIMIKLRDKTVPAAAKVSKEIKALEMELASSILEKKEDPKKLGELVNKISSLRTALTKAHLECIYDVQQALSAEQYAQLLKLASSK